MIPLIHFGPAFHRTGFPSDLHGLHFHACGNWFPALSVVVHVLDWASLVDVPAPPTWSAILLAQWVTNQGELARVVASMLQKQPKNPEVHSNAH